MTKQQKRFYIHKKTGVDIESPRDSTPKLYMLVWKYCNQTQYITKGCYAACIVEKQRQEDDPKWKGGEFEIILMRND